MFHVTPQERPPRIVERRIFETRNAGVDTFKKLLYIVAAIYFLFHIWALVMDPDFEKKITSAWNRARGCQEVQVPVINVDMTKCP